jgi:hypothetical protein
MRICETVKEIMNKLRGDSPIITVKSRIFFEILERIGFNNTMQMYFPPTGIGTASVFELTVITAILNLLKPLKITEIGTFTGYSTAVMALNSSHSTEVISIDLPKIESPAALGETSRNELLKDWKKNDDFLRGYQNLHGEYYIEKLPNSYRRKIRLIKCDSTALSPNDLRLIKNSDLFFIDGGHSRDVIACDTETALRSINETGWILWHDYNSKTHVEVTEFINDSFLLSRQVLHVENTMLAIYSPNFLKFFGQYAN